VTIDYPALAKCWRSLGLDNWTDEIESLMGSRMSSSSHGDFEQWRDVLASLPKIDSEPVKTKAALLQLSPWRKGPFEVGGVAIDAEWRSDLKWGRLADSVASLDGRNVLDVGCGNGYYALRMREAGARTVIGIDPTLLYVMQFLAVNHFVRDPSVFVLPLRLHELPGPARSFDTTFSMGVLYHQRSPIDHLRQLRDTLRPNGQLVLETLFLPGDEACARTPSGRYARMKNVWLLPTIAELTTWLERSGFRDLEVIDKTVTTTDEQRRTEWMSFESLVEALDPVDPAKTVEGWPSPRRVVVTASTA
jgi:tRNA (mo5U34)-methyltransferase